MRIVSRVPGWTCLLLLATGLAASAVLQAATAAARAALTADELVAGQVRGFVPMVAFTPTADATAPLRQFSGRLELGAAVAADFQVRWNQPFNIPVDEQIRSLPAFDFEFLQDGAAVIPLQRGPVENPHASWEWVLEPGRAWNEPADQGYTRVAIPFALQERNANCVHNGVLSFVIGDGGTVSKVYYEIASETCAYFKFDSWGVLAARFTPAVPAHAGEVAANYRTELAARLPLRPLAELIDRQPGLLASGLALAAPRDADPATAYGVVLDGVHYASSCATRQGDYPFCDVLALPSYSTAKTLVAAVGLMRLEQLSPGARRALISDYVPECATRDWRGVTFEHALDMATGVYHRPGYEQDEDATDVVAFYNYETHRERIGFSCRHYHRHAAPGTRWVYRTTDTYVLGAAMAEYARRKLQLQDFYTDVLAKPLWARLRLSPMLATTRRTRDASRQPFTGYGLSYHRDDIVRLAQFLSVGEGEIDGVAQLDLHMLRAALQRDPQNRGLGAGFPGLAYRDGVWARNIAGPLGCDSPLWVPFMSGYGGISVVMLPGGVVYYYYGDSGVWDWSPAAIELGKLRAFCPRALH